MSSLDLVAIGDPRSFNEAPSNHSVLVIEYHSLPRRDRHLRLYKLYTNFALSYRRDRGLCGLVGISDFGRCFYWAIWLIQGNPVQIGRHQLLPIDVVLASHNDGVSLMVESYHKEAFSGCYAQPSALSHGVECDATMLAQNPALHVQDWAWLGAFLHQPRVSA